MIYSIDLIIDFKFDKVDNNYYNVLWIILNLFNENQNVKKSIISISNIYNNLGAWKISISFLWKENFNMAINLLVDTQNININWKIYDIKWVDFNFSIFDNNIEYKNYKNIEITFRTPTIVKKEINWIDINQLLPNPEVFLISSIRKYIKYYNIDMDLEKIKNEIKNNVIVVSFDLKTKLFKIKWNNKAWLIWKIKYQVFDDLDFKYKKILYLSLKMTDLIWLWTWNKLWLWQVSVYFSN